MSGNAATMLPELHEHQATGRIADIYHEIRVFSGVPYVSSLQRYLATLPGVLEWLWDALRPALVSGVIPETGWRLARDVRLSPPDPVSVATVKDWGLDAAALTSVRNVAENFARVSPVNIMTGSCARLLLTGTRPSGAGFTEAWTPPAMLAPMQGNLDPAALPPDQRATMLRFATEIGGTPFIPALYRQIAHWPPVLAWLADELVPRLTAPETNRARDAFRQAAAAAAPSIVARLPGLPAGPAPALDVVTSVLTAIDRYARTSPEMTMFGRFILDALPRADSL